MAPPSLHGNCTLGASLGGTVLEERSGGRFLAPKHKEVSMVDRDDRTKHEQSGSGSSSQGKGQKTSRPDQENEGRTGQSKHTQGNPNPSRDDTGKSESGEGKGSQGTGRRSSDEEDTE
jgi:hypothetical protein